jgi:RNA polymerase sigma-70 factor (ECF subfamily)
MVQASLQYDEAGEAGGALTQDGQPGPDISAAEPEVTGTTTAEIVELVDRISRGEAGGMEELYSRFERGVRLYLARHLGSQDLDDKVHDTFVVVVQAIQRGELREPERLMGFIRTVVKRQVAGHIDRAVQSRTSRVELEHGVSVSDLHNDPEVEAIARQQEVIVEKVLRSIPQRDREILTRFYLMEQTQEQICEQMGLSETQFRLLKSRAKARFGVLGKKTLTRRKKILRGST